MINKLLKEETVISKIKNFLYPLNLPGKILVFLGSIFFFLIIYLVGGNFWMSYSARKAGLVNPSSPYEEEIAGNGVCKLLKVTVLGDSTAIGTGTSNRKQTFGYQVIRNTLLPIYSKVIYTNRAVSGAKVENVLEIQLPEALKDQPDLILISVGANDVSGLTSASDFKGRLEKVLDTLTNQTKAQIVLLGVPAIYSAPILLPLFPQFLDILTHRLIDAEELLLQKYPKDRILKVDIYNTTGPVFKKHPEYFAPDGYHPNDQGYFIWASEVQQILKPKLSSVNPC